jgi:hypothetical protein
LTQGSALARIAPAMPNVDATLLAGCAREPRGDAHAPRLMCA